MEKILPNIKWVIQYQNKVPAVHDVGLKEPVFSFIKAIALMKENTDKQRRISFINHNTLKR